MVWGNLIKAGVAIGATAITSEKLQSAVAGAIDKSMDRLSAMNSQDAPGGESESQKKSGNDKRNVTSKCMGCHAPMSGKPGVPYRCPYCDTVQTLD